MLSVCRLLFWQHNRITNGGCNLLFAIRHFIYSSPQRFMIKRLLILTSLILSSLSSLAQSENPRSILGEEFARTELERSLAENSLHNVVDGKKEIISDSTSAVEIAEVILFRIYGERNIKKQKPYEVYKIKHYWSIAGTLPRGSFGGTFLIIMDAIDGRIIRITHGK